MLHYDGRRLLRLRARWQRLCIEVTLIEIQRDIEDLDREIALLNDDAAAQAWRAFSLHLQTLIQQQASVLMAQQRMLESWFNEEILWDEIGIFITQLESRIKYLEDDIHAAESNLRLQYRHVDRFTSAALEDGQ